MLSVLKENKEVGDTKIVYIQSDQILWTDFTRLWLKLAFNTLINPTTWDPYDFI